MFPAHKHNTMNKKAWHYLRWLKPVSSTPTELGDCHFYYWIVISPIQCNFLLKFKMMGRFFSLASTMLKKSLSWKVLETGSSHLKKLIYFLLLISFGIHGSATEYTDIVKWILLNCFLELQMLLLNFKHFFQC